MTKRLQTILWLSLAIALFGWTVSKGLELHDRGECEYWYSIKADRNFHPTPLMFKQCNWYGINLLYGVN